MDMDFAEAATHLENDVDTVVNRAISRGMTPQEAAQVLRECADAWEEEEV